MGGSAAYLNYSICARLRIHGAGTRSNTPMDLTTSHCFIVILVKPQASKTCWHPIEPSTLHPQPHIPYPFLVVCSRWLVQQNSVHSGEILLVVGSTMSCMHGKQKIRGRRGVREKPCGREKPVVHPADDQGACLRRLEGGQGEKIRQALLDKQHPRHQSMSCRQ